jgi:outer membrane immunogenic protein
MFARKIVLALLAGTALSLAGAAKAADVYTPPPETPYTAPSPFTWSGVYFGVHVGYAWSKPKQQNIFDCNYLTNIIGENGDPGYYNICAAASDGQTDYAYIDDPDSYYDGDYVPFLNLDGDYVALTDSWETGSDSGFTYGGQIGVNAQYGMVVLGLEADISGVSGIDHTSGGEFDYFHSYDGTYLYNYEGTYWVESTATLQWLATFRGRFGLAMGSEGRFLPYLTAGAAVANVGSTLSTGADTSGGNDWCQGDCFFDRPYQSSSFYQFGYAAGVGIEYAFTNHITFGLEYLFVGLSGGQTNTVTFYGDDGRAFNINQTVGLDNIQMVRAKLNFLFPVH